MGSMTLEQIEAKIKDMSERLKLWKNYRKQKMREEELEQQLR